MIENSATFVALLVLMGKINPYEADKLQKELFGKPIPKHWRDLVSEIEVILERPLE